VWSSEALPTGKEKKYPRIEIEMRVVMGGINGSNQT
jgi:hypothetical protein